MSDNGTKHVSGDNLSRAVESGNDIDKNISIEDEVPDDDTSSVHSDLSDGLDLLPNNSNVANNANNNLNNLVNNLNQPRGGQRELNSLGQVPRLPRLRSGRF